MSLAQVWLAGSIRIHTVVFRHTGSIRSTIFIKRDISNATFDNVDEYKKQPKKRQDALQKAIDFAEAAGLDAAGAEEVSLP